MNNEHDVKVNASASNKPFETLSLTGNIFTSSDTPAWFTYIRLAPYGAGHTIDGISVIGNTFKTIGSGTIDRVEGVDTSEGSFDHGATKAVTFTGNSFDSVVERTESPAVVRVTTAGVSNSWSVDLSAKLPFGGQALGVDAVMPQGDILDGGGVPQFVQPAAQLAGNSNVAIKWPTAVSGTVHMVARVDLPY